MLIIVLWRYIQLQSISQIGDIVPSQVTMKKLGQIRKKLEVQTPQACKDTSVI